MKRDHKRLDHRARGSGRVGAKDTKMDASRERRALERGALRKLSVDPESDAELPTQTAHAGNPWRWD